MINVFSKMKQNSREDQLKALLRYNSFYRKSPAAIMLEGKNWFPSRYAKFDAQDKINLQSLSGCRCLNCPDGYVKLIRENEQCKSFVSEALINTYPIKQLQTLYKKWYENNVIDAFQHIQLKDITSYSFTNIQQLFGPNAQPYIELIDYADVQDYAFDNPQINGIVTFYIPLSNEQSDNIKTIADSLADTLYVCGWDLANYELMKGYVSRIPVDFLMATFEARYQDFSFEFEKWLYHATTLKVLKKISKNGLVPKSQSNMFKYPDRVYLFSNCSIRSIIDYAYSSKLQNDDNECRLALLRIDSQKLQDDPLFKSGKMKFYIDQKFASLESKHPMALFTYSNVPRRLIDDEVSIYQLDKNGVPIDIQTHQLENIS